MDLSALAPYLAGPGAAVLVLLLVGLGVYRLVVQYFIPLMQSAVSRHMEELERANSRHESAVAKHLDHIREMGVRYDALSSQHAKEHNDILQAVEALSEKVSRHPLAGPATLQ